MRLQRHDLHTLTGSYALDALQGEELDEFERHLNHCSSCATEIRGLRATAARLSMAAAERPPAAMRGRVLALAERTRQLPPLTDERPARRGTSRQVRRARRVWFPRISVAVAAVATAVAVVLGVSQIHSQSQLSTTQSQLAALRSQLSNAEAHNHAITAVLAASDARLVSSKTTRGGTVTAIVSASESKLLVLTSSLPPCPPPRSMSSGCWARPRPSRPACSASRGTGRPSRCSRRDRSRATTSALPWSRPGARSSPPRPRSSSCR